MTPDIIRAWAKSQGIQIGDRGRIKAEIREAYITAMKTEATCATARGDSIARRAALDALIERPTPPPSEPVAKVKAPRPARTRAKPEIKSETLRVAGSVSLEAGDPMRVAGEQGNWRFLAVVVQPTGTVYIDCVDPHGNGRAISPDRLEAPRKGITRDLVGPGSLEMQANHSAHSRRRG